MVRFDPFDASVGYVGDSGGGLFRIDALGTSNSATRIDNGTFGAADVTALEIDPFDSSGSTLYVTLADYASDRVYKSADGGATWQSIHANLPDIPMFSIVSDPSDADRLWLGSELGLWTSAGNLSGSYDWQRYDYGTAFTRVVTLKWNDPSTLYIGTHGRGSFKASRSTAGIELGAITTQAGCDADQFIDLGETASVPLEVTNLSGQVLAGASLAVSTNYPGLSIAPASIALGDVLAHASTTGTFTLSISQLQGSCLDQADLTASLMHDQGMEIHPLQITLAADPTSNTDTFVADAEGDETAMMVTSALGDTPWVRQSSVVHSGSKAWFVADAPHLADSSLSTPWLDVGNGNTVLSFWLNYNTEGDFTQLWDGAVLEMRTATEPERWIDIGGRSSVPYDGPLHINNSARGRMAWAGAKGTWRNAMVDLGGEVNAQRVQFRFRMIADQSTGKSGFRLDDLSITNVSYPGVPACDLTQCAAQLVPTRGLAFDPVRDGHGLELQKAGDTYFLLFYTYADDGNPEWFLGTGTQSGGVVTIPAGQLDRFSYDFNAGAAEIVAGGGGGASLDFNISPNDPLCSGQDRSTAVGLARFDWDIEGEQGSWCTQMLEFDSGSAQPDVSGTWFAGSDDSGWGLTIATQGSTLVAVLYFYDANGDARWVLGSGDYTPGQAATISMDQFQGFCRTCAPGGLVSNPAGTLNITLSTPATIADPGNKTTVDVTFTGVDGSTWKRTDAPIRLLSEPAG